MHQAGQQSKRRKRKRRKRRKQRKRRKRKRRKPPTELEHAEGFLELRQHLTQLTELLSIIESGGAVPPELQTAFSPTVS